MQYTACRSSKELLRIGGRAVDSLDRAMVSNALLHAFIPVNGERIVRNYVGNGNKAPMLNIQETNLTIK